MIEELKPYPETRDSGLAWLGKIPAHWGIMPVARLARPKSIVGQPDRQLLSVYLQRGVVRFTEIAEKRTNATSGDFGKYQAVDPGDFVLNNQQAWRGSVGVSTHTGIVSPEYLVLSLSGQYVQSYANWLFRDQCMVYQYLICSKGVGSIQRNLYWPHLKRVGALLPPPEEQAAIARFLAWATNRLDRAIQAKRRIIALLNEQKQAIIHRAVTRGLDPSVPLKDSGVPWLGEIPEHWEARKLGTLFCLQGSGTTPSGERYYGGSINWVMSGDLNDEVVSTTKRSVQAVALEFYSALKLYPPGSLVIAMYGATIGKTGILGKHACTNQGCCVLAHPACGAKETFLQLAVQAAKPHLMSEAYGGGQPNINAEIVRALRIGLPPANQQQLILQSINSSTHQIRTAIVRLEREIALLLEYRTRLIADVVTGKLDVREAAAGLPEEAESLDTADQNEVIGELEPDEDEEPELK